MFPFAAFYHGTQELRVCISRSAFKRCKNAACMGIATIQWKCMKTNTTEEYANHTTICLIARQWRVTTMPWTTSATHPIPRREEAPRRNQVALVFAIGGLRECLTTTHRHHFPFTYLRSCNLNCWVKFLLTYVWVYISVHVTNMCACMHGANIRWKRMGCPVLACTYGKSASAHAKDPRHPCGRSTSYRTAIRRCLCGRTTKFLEKSFPCHVRTVRWKRTGCPVLACTYMRTC